ncbi:MAG: hypothetical protein KKB81_03480 [Candidatus Margulisbacteria bacterium]|nr:hypothetical protein [Candidatus Margulisiibacteriota bacterium]MBU1021027.1 hypothetical protein [Candidatus Margulisiibacteriota bacterium]MBU1729606.1 hypothetical protein [Candidatus Margulisiibacteriota bacterium]MBU1956031.1 hypothetical protein [Candidatus Margulisiibacteriota bacterium]
MSIRIGENIPRYNLDEIHARQNQDQPVQENIKAPTSDGDIGVYPWHYPQESIDVEVVDARLAALLNGLSPDNVLRKVFAIEVERVGYEVVEEAYEKFIELLDGLSDYVRRDAIPEVRIGDILGYLVKERNFNVGEHEDNLFVEDLLGNNFDCDTSSLFILAAAQELGLNDNNELSLVYVPGHVFLQWNDGDLQFNYDQGDFRSDEYYHDNFGEMVVLDLSTSEGQDGIRALAYFNRGLDKHTIDPDGALVDYEQAAALMPKLSAAWVGQGIFFLEQSDYERAEEYFVRAAELQPNYSVYQRNLGYVREMSGNAEGSE